jgi:nucleotidyltransferase/DNA polymerase involved in DNA repair
LLGKTDCAPLANAFQTRSNIDAVAHQIRERKSSGSETTFPEDLTGPARIEAGVIAMADEVWRWCERANSRGRTVTVSADRLSFTRPSVTLRIDRCEFRFWI